MRAQIIFIKYVKATITNNNVKQAAPNIICTMIEGDKAMPPLAINLMIGMICQTPIQNEHRLASFIHSFIVHL